MRNILAILLIVITFISCVSILKPMKDPRCDLISDFEKEMDLNECELNFMSVVYIKRIFEEQFPKNQTELKSLIISEQIIDSLRFDLDKSSFVDSVQFYFNQAYILWKENCLNSWDRFEITPYGSDSVDISWSKHVDYEDGKKKEYFEEWRCIYESDSLLNPILLKIEVILLNSKGKEINSIKGNENNVVTKQIPIG
jgi:hypothetical protein